MYVCSICFVYHIYEVLGVVLYISSKVFSASLVLPTIKNKKCVVSGTSMSVEESTTTAAPVLIQPTRMATSRAYKTKSLLFINCISQHFVSLEEVSLGGFGFVCSFPFLLYFTIFPFLVH